MTAPDLDLVRARLAAYGRSLAAADVALTLGELGLLVSDETVRSTISALRRDSVGAGPLDELLVLPGLTDVLVNGPGQVFVDRGAGLELTDVRFDSDEQVQRLAARLVGAAGRRLDVGMPFGDARLADGTRVHAVLGCVAAPGTCLSLRVPGARRFPLSRWVEEGGVTEEGARLLRRVVEARVPFLVSGGTGSGKTTLLAALLELVPPTERVVVVEDSRELEPAHPHCVHLEGRPVNGEGAGAITLTDLVRQALRMRPDRLVVGEVRGGELVDLLIALNTGHEGGCGTIHANTAGAVPARLEALAALGGLDRHAAHAQVAAALRVVVHVRRLPSGRRVVAQLAVLARGAGDLVQARIALTRTDRGVLEPGPAAEDLAEALS